VREGGDARTKMAAGATCCGEGLVAELVAELMGAVPAEDACAMILLAAARVRACVRARAREG
jgi:hypothetical protein